jgi:hypothetical protein
MGLSRKDFNDLAAKIKSLEMIFMTGDYMVSKQKLIEELLVFCHGQNADFDCDRFIDACY